jgi:uncharacterized membrane protein YkoI
MMFSTAMMVVVLAAAPAAFAASPRETGISPGVPATNSAGQKAVVASPDKEATTSPVRFISLYERVTPKDISAFGAGPVSLDEAIADAQRTTNGTAVDAEFKAGPGKPHYVVWVTKDNRLYRSTVDAENGAVVGAAHGFTLHRLNPSERADVGVIEQAKADLADAVAIAAKDSNGEPIAASLEREEGIRAYHVSVIEKGALQSLWVSPDNPTIVAAN